MKKSSYERSQITRSYTLINIKLSIAGSKR